MLCRSIDHGQLARHCTCSTYHHRLGLTTSSEYYCGAEAGRFIQPDPIGFNGGDTNLYAYVKNAPVKYRDPKGEKTYYGFRKIDSFLIPRAVVQHTYIFVVSPEGVIHTFSWGNSADKKGWNFDQPEDLAAAIESLRTGKNLEEAGDDSLDEFIFKRFNKLSQEPKHWWMPWSQCKTAAYELVEGAKSDQAVADDYGLSFITGFGE